MAPNDNRNDNSDNSEPYAAELAPDASDVPAARAPRKRASRRVTKAATAVVSPAESGADDAPADGHEMPATEPTEASSTQADAEPDPLADAVAPAAKRAPRKRAPRKKAAAPELPSVADEPLALVADEADAVAAADEVGPPAVVDPDAFIEHDDLFADLLAGVDLTDDDDDDDAQPSILQVPTFGLLFQAPDPTAATRGRRRQPPAFDSYDRYDTSDSFDAAEAEETDDDAVSTTLDKRAPAGRAGRGVRAVRAVEADSDEGADSDDGADGADGADSGDDDSTPRRSRRRRGGKGRRGRSASDDDADGDTDGDDEGRDQSGPADDERESDDSAPDAASDDDEQDDGEESTSSRRRRRRRRAGSSTSDSGDETVSVSTRVRQPRAQSDEPVAVKGSTRLEAKKQRRREGREAGRRRTIITEAEFLARREAVDRVMVVRNKEGRTQMGVLEDGVLVEHYIDQATNVSMAGNIYLGRVQNVLPSMEAAFVDIGKGRNAVLYAGEVNWDAAGLESNQPKRIENALGSGQTVLVQVTKDPIGHKGARLTSQISLPGRYLVYVPNSSMTGISRKLPDTERARLKKILRDVVPDTAGVIVRTAAEGASEEELRADVERLTRTWESIQARAEGSLTPRAGKSKGKKKNGGSGSTPAGTAPMLLHGEPDLTVRVIRDVFNEDFKQLVVSGEQAWNEIHPYISSVAPDLADRVTRWTGSDDLFTHHRVDEQLAKAMDRKVWLPSGGSLVIDRTEAMTVVDVNTGKFVGSGGNLEETVTKNNIEAAEEIVRQLRLRDIGGIIVIDFIDMVLESNRDLVVRRLLECLGRDRTKHQVAEVTSLGLVQMTRKRVGSGLIEVFSESCDHCNGRGYVIHTDPVAKGAAAHEPEPLAGRARRARRGAGTSGSNGAVTSTGSPAATSASSASSAAAEPHKPNGPTAAQIAAAAHAAAVKAHDHDVHADDADDADEAGDAHEAQQAPLDVEAENEVEVEAQVGEAAMGVEHEAPHAFPDDSGPWDASDDQPDGEPEPGDAPAVEVESDLPVLAELSPVEAFIDDEPAPRARRRRGRVVAPAGPPRAASADE